MPPGPPGAPPPGGAMAAPPGGVGAAMAPEPMAGAGAHAQESVKTGLELLQKALPGLPMGSDLHTAVLQAITKISPHVGKGADDQSGMMQQLVAAARQAKQQPAQSAMMKMFPGAEGAQGAPPGAAPPPGM